MKLDMELRHTLHKNGGRITRVHRIGHHCVKPVDGRSQDVWFFVGDVDWNDGGKSRETEIPPYAVCYTDREPEGKAEIDDIMAFLSDYLLINGDWYRDGKSGHEGWYANVRPQAKKRRAA